MCPGGRGSERSGALLLGRNDPGFVRMVVDALLNGLCGMDWADYLRDQATMYRQLAERTDDPAVQNEMLEWRLSVRRSPITWRII